MATQLSSLKDCCQNLASRNATERKKSAEKLPDLLSNDATCQLLSLDSHNSISWAYVLDQAVLFFQLQLTKLEDDLRCGKNLSSKLRISQEAVSVLRSVVRRANRHGRILLDMVSLLNVITGGLQHEFRREACGAELCQLLRESFLLERLVFHRLDMNAWHSLVGTLRRLVNIPIPRLTTTVLYDMLTLAVKHGCVQTALKPAVFALLPVIRGVGEHKQLSPDAALDLVISVLTEVSSSDRLAVSEVGGYLLIPVLRMTNDKCLEKTLHFVDLLIQSGKAEMSRDHLSDGWMVNLRKIYQFTLAHVETVCRQSRREGRSGYHLPVRLSDVFSDVVYLLYKNNVCEIDVTQPLTLKSDSSGQPAKRRRLELGVGALVEKIMMGHDQIESLPWIQLLTRLLTNHRDLLDVSDLSLCLDMVYQQLNNCSAPVLAEYHLRLAVCLLNSNCQVRCNVGQAKHQEVWNNIWHATIKSSALVRCEEVSHTLLQELICHRLIVPGLLFLDLFVQGTFKPSSYSVQTLVCYLRLYNQPVTAVLQSKLYIQRVKLVSWIVTGLVEFPAGCNELAELLTRVVLRDTTCLELVGLSSRKSIHHEHDFRDNFDVHIEVNVLSQCPNPIKLPPDACVNSLKDDVTDGITRLLALITENQLDFCSSCRILRLVVDVMVWWVDIAFLPPVLTDSPLGEKLRLACDVLLNSILEKVESDTVQYELLSMLPAMEAVVCCLEAGNMSSTGRRSIAKLLMPAATEKFMCSFLHFVSDMDARLLTPDQRMKQHTDSTNSVSDYTTGEELSFDLDNARCNDMLDSASSSKNAVSCRLLTALFPVTLIANAESIHPIEELRVRAFSFIICWLLMDCGSCSDLLASVFTTGENDERMCLHSTLCNARFSLSYQGDLCIVLGLLVLLPLSSSVCSKDLFYLNGLLLRVCRECMQDGDVAFLVMRLMAERYVGLVVRLGSDCNLKDINTFVRIFQVRMRSGKGGEQCLLQFLRLVCNLCIADESGRLCTVDQVWVGETILTHFSTPEVPSAEHCLLWSTHASRMEAAKLTGKLFAFREQVEDNLTVPSLKEMFELAHKACEQGLRSSTELASTQMFEKPHNRATVLVSCLVEIALASTRCRPAALSAMCQAVVDQPGFLTLVHRAIRLLAKAFGAQSSRHLIMNYADVIYPRLMSESFHISDFPWKLMDYEKFEEFVNDQFRLLIPHLLDHSLTEVAFISEVLKRDQSDLILDCLPRIICAALPLVSDEMQNSRSSLCSVTLYSNARRLVSDSGEFDRAVLSSAQDVILQIYRLHGDAPPLINRCVKVASGSLYGGSLVTCLKNPADALQFVLSGLASDVYSSRQFVDNVQVASKIAAFVRVVADDFENLECMTSYVVRYVISFIICQLSQTQLPRYHRLAHLYLDCLDHFVRCCNEFSQECLAREVHCVCTCLKKLASNCADDQQIISKTVELANFLLAELSVKYNTVADQAALIGSLRILDTSLNGCLDLLARVNAVSVPDCSVSAEFLSSLHDLLTSCGNLSTADKSRLVSRLLYEIPSSEDHILRGIGLVIGQVGPLPSDCRFSPPTPVAETFDLNCSEDRRDVRLLMMMYSLLWHSQPEVSSAVGVALRCLLASPSGKRIMKAVKSECLNVHQQLYPFEATCASANPIEKMDSDQAIIDCLDDVNLWIPEHGQFDKWVREIALALLSSAARLVPYLSACRQICVTAEPAFSASLIPYLVELSVRSIPSLNVVIGKWINMIFEQHCHHIQSDTPSGISTCPNISATKGTTLLVEDKRTVKTLLNVIKHLRLQPLPSTLLSGRNDSPWESNFWLPLYFLGAAYAAVSVNSLYEALLLAEVWFLQTSVSGNNGVTSHNDCSTQLQSILLEVYGALNDLDGLDSIQSGKLSDMIRLRHLEHQGNFSAALFAYDSIAGSHPAPSVQSGLVRCLRELQLFSTLTCYVQTANESYAHPQSHLTDAMHESVWRLGEWSTPVPTDPGAGFHGSLFTCLTAYRDSDMASAIRAIDQGVETAVKRLADLAHPVAHSVNLVLVDLQVLASAEQLCLATDPEKMRTLCHRWSQVPPDRLSYEFEEPVLAARAAMLQLAGERHGCLITECQRIRQSILLEVCAKARRSGRVSAARRTIQLLPSDLLDVKRSAAANCWTNGEHHQAIRIYQDILVHNLPNDSAPAKEKLEFARLKVEYASWLAETYSESPQSIIDDHLTPATEILEQLPSGDEVTNALLDAHYLVGQYVDTQLQRINEYICSAAYSEKESAVGSMLKEAETLKSCPGGTSRDSEVKRKARNLETLAAFDQSDLEQCHVDRRRFLNMTVSSYISCLRLGGIHDMVIYRVVAIWLGEQCEEVTDLLTPSLVHIPSYKWVPVIQQIAARLGRRGAGMTFVDTLGKLLVRCGTDHPHHTLPILLALVHALEDPSTKTSVEESTEARISATDQLLVKLSGKSEALSQHIIELRLVFKALIKLANHTVQSSGNPKSRIPSSCGLTRLTALSSVAVQTDTVPINKCADYSRTVTVVSWDNSIEMVGGVNAPKKLHCKGSDGIRRPQLLKGQDDLRQDAVMEQVFDVVNQLLSKNNDLSRQKLAIRTYKVVPLSQRSGLIEWCINTTPMAAYLTGAHKTYYPQDIRIAEARKAMSMAARKPQASKKETYLNICSRLHPVFRHFFFEKFPNSSQWYERRCCYTNSVAVSSMSGYMLGLGDRHVNNMLLDLVTAEVIHIDLGVAFETGRLLPTPETVPFRLTRDIVDGMGVCGVEGRFRRSCERTLSVLRQNSDIVLTIVRVLLDDPLYVWTLTPEKVDRVQKRQPASANHVHNDNQMAERVLLRLTEKLRGQELGHVMACTAQVNHLIQEARDVHNLSRLFPGWQPYL